MTRLRVGVLRALPVGVGVFVVFVVLNTLPAVLFGRDVVVFTVLLPFKHRVRRDSDLETTTART